jgi:hypothetical protein
VYNSVIVMSKISRAERRQHLFELYSTNCAFYWPDFVGNFRCPICGNYFGKESLQGGALAVDIAHVYPKACGGKPETMTCCACNNWMGRKYDHHVAVEHRTYNALHPQKEGTITGRLRFDGGSVGIELSRNATGFLFHEVRQQTNPAERNALIKLMQEGAGDGKVRFRLEHRWISDRHLNTAILHSAYLTLFRQYGYEYAACADNDWIRAALRAEEPPEKPGYLCVNVPRDSGFSERLIFGAGIARLDGLKTLVAALPSAKPEYVARLVLLPGIGERGRMDYLQLRGMPSRKASIEYDFHFGIPDQRLRTRGAMWFLNEFWNSKT